MTSNLHRLLFTIAAATSLPIAASGEPATPPPAPRAPDPVDALSPQDREALSAAEQLAAASAQVLEQWLSTQATTEGRLFSRMYFPIPKTDPQKFSTPYDGLADRDLVGVEDKALTRSTAFQYAIVTDINAYVPAHNSRFAQPLSGVAAQDYVNNRTKRMYADPASLQAARSEARFLVQRTRTETGDVVYDVAVPITVHGKHWGCARVGYRKAE
jgi:methyl-accepting chemotaxis protein